MPSIAIFFHTGIFKQIYGIVLNSKLKQIDNVVVIITHREHT